MIWRNCYDEGWKREIVPEAFAHPAKFSRALIRRIYVHAFEQGWLEPGMTVMDPFAGVGLGALDAMWNGLNYVGVELESKFVKLAEQNLALWQRKYGTKKGWGTARIVQGDSRELGRVIEQAGMVISSPPFIGVDGAKRFNNEEERQRFLQGQRASHPGRSDAALSKMMDKWVDMGSSPGQLGAMKEGDFDCVVGSPPYAGSAVEKNSTSIDRAKQYETYRAQGGGASFEKFCATQEKHSNHYGLEPGQLGSLPEGRFEAVISSPPYEASRVVNGETQNGDISAIPEFIDSYGAGSTRRNQESRDTFWSSAREILEQCYAILRPGGHAIFVCKDFVRKGKRVSFSDQWLQLCESVGFRLVCRHRAMLITAWEEETLFGVRFEKKERKSFFRRLAEKKGSPPINWEDVLCLKR